MTQAEPGQRLREGVAEEIRSLMARRRISGVRLASEIGRTQAYVSRRLVGEVAFDVDDLERIARVLGVSVQALLPNDPTSRVLTVPTSPVGTVRRTADDHHVVDVRSHGGSVATSIRRPHRRSARPTGTPLMAAAGMVVR